VFLKKKLHGPKPKTDCICKDEFHIYAFLF